MVCPLDELPPAMRAEIEALSSAPEPPPRWIHFIGAKIMSRSFYEWHLRRGRDVSRQERDPISKTLRATVIARDGLVCGICRGAVQRTDVHIDHIRPSSRGGLSLLPNLRVTHSRCNLRRGAARGEAF